MKKYLVLVLFFVVFTHLKAQENSWIDYGHRYYKIPITKKGVYRISYLQLINFGLDPIYLSSIENKIRMFAKGKEIPLYINNLSNSNVGYIEFVVDKIDGELDGKMFRNPKDHINPYIPIYSDTLYHFLTWNEDGPDGKRMLVETDIDFDNYIPLDYCWVEQLDNANKSFKIGYSRSLTTDNRKTKFFAPKHFGYVTLFRYGRANYSELNNNTVVGLQTMNTPSVYYNGPDAVLETRMDGHTNTQSQEFFIQVNDTKIIEETFQSFNSMNIQQNIPINLLKESNVVYYENLNKPTGRISVGYTKITYPHTYDFNNLSEMYFKLPQSQDQKDYIEISNFNYNNKPVRIYDLDAGKRINVQIVNGKLKALVPNFNNGERNCLITSDYMILNVEKIIPVGQQSTLFTNYKEIASQINQPDFIIITHSSLINEAQNYAQYKNASGYKTLVVDVEQLYMQYSWGIPNHPYAIRAFIKDLITNNTIDPQYLFIIGKGLGAVHSKSVNKNNLVPTWGVNGSDIGFTSYLKGNNLEPLMATGRLAATTPDEVSDYLAKVKQHEANKPEEWMKNILHFIGGETKAEQDDLLRFMNIYKSIAEQPLMGAKVHSFFKNSTSPLQINVSDSVTNLINNGTTLMTFFGHAYGSNFDQSLDNPQNYKNEGKYPFLLANSCLIGNIYNNNKSSGSEQFVLAKQKGTIGFLGSTVDGIDKYLNTYSSNFYKNFANNYYGKSVGKIINKTISDIVNNDILIQDLCNSMTLHGDPSIVLNAASKPDYSVLNAELIPTANYYTFPKIITNERDSFDIHIIVTNIGKAQNDTLDVLIKRKFPNENEPNTFLTKKILPVYFKDTITFRFSIDQLNGVGLNTFEVQVDNITHPIDEITKENNITTFNVPIEGSDIQPIYPYEFAIVSDYLPILKASTQSSIKESQNYIFEIDTTETFNSPIKLSLAQTSLGGVIEWNPEQFPELKLFFQKFNSANQLNSANVFYWRVALQNNINWRSSSFQYVNDKTGWGQAHWGQFAKNTFNFMQYQAQPKNLSFIEQIKTLEINTNGILKREFTWDDAFKVNYKLNGSVMSMTTKTNHSIIVGVIDKKNLLPWHSQKSGDFGHNNYIKNYEPAWNSYSFEFSLPSKLQELINFLNAVPDSNYIFMYNFNSHNLSKCYLDPSLGTEFIDLMKSLGSNVDSITKYPNDFPYIFFTQKGNSNNKREITTITKNDFIQCVQPLKNNWLDGDMYSTMIGPGKNWKSLHWEVLPENPNNFQDTTQLFLYGIQNDGTKVLLLDTLARQGDFFDLESTTTNNYTNLQLKYHFINPNERTPSKPIRWQIVHDEIPELALNPLKISNYKAKDTVQQGETLFFITAIQNISSVTMPSFKIQNWIISNTNSKVNQNIKSIQSLASGEIFFDTVYVETKDLQGLNSLWYEINPKELVDEWQAEKFHFNNSNLFSFYIKTDKINPILDVSFDGIRILNGDIVSSNPEIVITLNDENPYLKLDDPSLMQVYIKYPNASIDSLIPESEYTFIPASGNKNQARIIFNRKFYKDGKYELGVQAKDKSNNVSGKGYGAFDLKIQFHIETKSSITQLINYPNPFSTSTRFVFVLTGDKIPDEIRIQIMSITGKVVREIDQNELGPINIGRNITDFAWDGKDQFGDQLANGVYFYRVIVKKNGEVVEERKEFIENSTFKGDMGDKLFKNGFGKMYLLK